MTPVSTERRSLPTQEPSGGEMDSNTSPTREMPRQQDTDSGPANLVKQSSATQIDGGLSRPSLARQASANLTAANIAAGASVLAQDDSNNGALRKDKASEEPKHHSLDTSSTAAAKELVEQSSLPYPIRPTVWKRKGSGRKATGVHGLDAGGIDPKKRTDAQRPNGLPKLQQDAALSDYTPWAGNHIEDRVSELVIKGGYQAKQQVLNETNTARPTLGPHLKSSVGLPNLSAFFASVLQRRQEDGRVTAASTFKPPPRVTLTDTKREVWLGELANPSVPLRKLSRTIPHGIRGKALLEQCSAKNLPMARAVWLAKCVGANELRAFRRKGISGVIMLENEQKWIKDWTVVLECFVEDAGRVSDQPEWKSKMIYALQLTSRLFADGLLDKDHFLDWALTKLESATSERLPFALLVVKMICPTVTQSLKHGCRLASIALSKLNELSKSPDRDLFAPLVNQILRLVITLALQHPKCFIVQRIWATCRDTFHSMISEVEGGTIKSAGDAQEFHQQDAAKALRQVKEKNDHIARATCRSIDQEEPRILSLIRKLDSLPPQTSIEIVASACLTAVPDVEQLISILIQWAASLYREGLQRTLIAVRLIRQWRDEGHDTDKHIIRSLQTIRHTPGLSPRILSRLIAELIRSESFDTARFLRSLISTGGLNSKHPSYDLQILIDMPVSHLQPSVLSLRGMLIRGCNPGHAVRQEIERNVNSLFNAENLESHLSEIDVDPAGLKWSEVFAISESIRRSLLYPSATGQSDKEFVQNTTTNLGHSAVQLHRVGTLLEAIGDVIAIADFLLAVIPTADTEFLAIPAAMLERHFEDLAAAGAIEPLFQRACDRYRTLRATMPPTKRLVLLLHSVCTRLSETSQLSSYLRHELASCDTHVGIAANTPMSDLQVETASETEIELERFLAGGAVMDYQRFSHAFDAIVARAAKSSSLDQGYSALLSVIGTLNAQNEERFQEVFASWLRVKLSTGENNILGGAISFLLSAGCVDLATIATTVDQICNQLATEDADVGVFASLKALELFFPQSPNTHGQYDVRLRLGDVSRISEVNPECVLLLLCRCLKAGRDSTSNTEMERLIGNTSLLNGLKRIFVNNTAAVGSVLQQQMSPETHIDTDLLKHLLASLVDPSGELGFVKLSNAEQIRIMFDTVNGFSMPFYQFYLKSLKVESTGSPENQFAPACLKALVDCKLRNCPFWPTLISAMDVTVAQQVRNSVERRVLIECSNPGEVLNSLRQSEYADARFWTKIVEATSFSIPEQGEPETGRNVEKHITWALSLVTSGLEAQDELFQQWLQALCELAVIHSRSCSGVIKAKIVHNLCGLLARNVGQLTEESLSSVFDAASYFVDDFTPQVFTLVRSNLGPLKNDRRVQFLFGLHENADAWLYVSRASPAQQAQVGDSTTASPFPMRRWELLPESAANVGANDTALSLRLFDATKIR